VAVAEMIGKNGSIPTRRQIDSTYTFYGDDTLEEKLIWWEPSFYEKNRKDVAQARKKIHSRMLRKIKKGLK